MCVAIELADRLDRNKPIFCPVSLEAEACASPPDVRGVGFLAPPNASARPRYAERFRRDRQRPVRSCAVEFPLLIRTEDQRRGRKRPGSAGGASWRSPATRETGSSGRRIHLPPADLDGVRVGAGRLFRRLDWLKSYAVPASLIYMWRSLFFQLQVDSRKCCNFYGEPVRRAAKLALRGENDAAEQSV